MKIEILGTGCNKCKKLYETTQAAVANSGITAEIVKVKDISKIMQYFVMMMPAIVVNGVVKASGRIPSEDEIKGWLK